MVIQKNQISQEDKGDMHIGADILVHRKKDEPMRGEGNEAISELSRGKGVLDNRSW